jgi:hypothetical protein
MGRNSETRGDVFSYATHSATSVPSDQHSHEVEATLAELISSFGEDVILAAIQLTPLGRRIGQTDEKVNEALRGFSIIICESRWPKLDAQLVGRIAQMEIATGKRLKMDELGRQYGGQSKQAISKRQGEIARRLGLPNPDSTPASRESHRLMNRSNASIA